MCCVIVVRVITSVIIKFVNVMVSIVILIGFSSATSIVIIIVINMVDVLRLLFTLL